MALTSQQTVDVRRYMGYSVSGDSTSLPYRELVYSDVAFSSLSLDYRLGHLSPEEENTLVVFYLANLAAREQDIQNAACNLDTDVAAVWQRNKSEIEDRREMFQSLRRDLCHFLGFPPGEALMGQTRLIRR